jgi:hypothetical protein
MDGKWKILLFLSVIGVGSVFGQSFQYQYTDPCTGILNTVTISQPNGSVTLFYAGQWQTFTQSQLLGGGYEQWIAQINAQFPPGSNPCAGNGGQTANNSNSSTATNTAGNVSGIVSIAAGLGSQASSINVAPPSSGPTETNSTDGGGTDNTTTASGGDSESSSDGGGSGGKAKPKSKQEKIGRGALIGAGDFVMIRNSSDIKESGKDNFRFNMSLTHVNTKQTFIKGINFNFTTGENNLNTTLYGSYKKKDFMGVFSNSTMTNFKSDIFNTTTILAAQKAWIVTPMLGTNFTIGVLGESVFQNWSVVGGGYTNLNTKGTIGGNVMLLGIYSPYIFYYEGQWYKSGILLVPLANLDMKLTDKFKWSISFGGAYQYNEDILNFQLSTGTKLML